MLVLTQANVQLVRRIAVDLSVNFRHAFRCIRPDLIAVLAMRHSVLDQAVHINSRILDDVALLDHALCEALEIGGWHIGRCRRRHRRRCLVGGHSIGCCGCVNSGMGFVQHLLGDVVLDGARLLHLREGTVRVRARRLRRLGILNKNKAWF